MKKTADIIFVHCPICQKKVEWSNESSFRPFCSKRCQLIDLGDWAAEEHRIPDKKITEQDHWSEDDLFHLINKE